MVESHTAADARHNHETMITLSGITVARVRDLEFTPYVGRVCFLLFVHSFPPIGFTRVLRFFPQLSSKTNTSQFQFILERKDTFKEFLRIPKSFVGRQITVYSLAKFNTYILHSRPF